MEALQNKSVGHAERYIASPDHQYQKYCNINLSESASSDRSMEKLYKVASIVAMVVGAILLIGVVAGVAIASLAIPGVGPALAAALASLVLVGGSAAYRRVFYEGFESNELGISFGVIPWKKKAAEYRKKAELNEGIAKMAKLAMENNPSLSPLQANFVGRMDYWKNAIESSSGRMDELRREIQEHNLEISRIKATCSPEDLKPIKAKLDKALRELNRVTVAEHIAAKVKTAYFYHVAQNPTETHRFDEFGTLETDSFLESLEGQSISQSSNIFYSNLDHPKKNWTVQDLLSKDYKEISQEIFSKTIKAA